jgi:hypothetical protein
MLAAVAQNHVCMYVLAQEFLAAPECNLLRNWEYNNV